MSLTYGFFNSIDGDRKYSAREFGSIFDGVIEDGVYGKIGDAFKVYSKNIENDMRVYIGTGRAWFLHTWTLNTTDKAITVPDSEVILNRWDAVVLEINHKEAYRRNAFKIISGTPAQNPVKPSSYVSTDDMKEIPIAYIYVPGKATYIKNSNIVQNVGTSQCPIVTSPLTSITVERLMAQWEAQYLEWLEHNGIAWRNWFDHIQTELDEDVAGHLQRQIDEIAKFAYIYVVRNVLYVPISGASITDKTLFFRGNSPEDSPGGTPVHPWNVEGESATWINSNQNN